MATRKKKKKQRRLPEIALTREGALRWLNGTATVVVFGGLVAGAVFGAPALVERFEQARAEPGADRSAGEHDEIVVNWPTWLPSGEQQRLAQVARFARDGAGDRPLSAEPLQAIGVSLERAGWFEAPPRVERAPGGEIRVEGAWLEPRFAVRWPPTTAATPAGSQQRDLIVTRDGRLTPMWYPVDGSGLPLVLAPKVGPPARADGAPAFGRTWGDEAVGHAISLLELLAAEPYFDQILGVSAAEYPTSGRLLIVTRWGTEIVWGSPLGVDATHRGEVKVAQRLASLRELQARYTRVDAAQRRVEVFGPSVEIDYSSGQGR